MTPSRRADAQIWRASLRDEMRLAARKYMPANIARRRSFNSLASLSAFHILRVTISLDC